MEKLTMQLIMLLSIIGFGPVVIAMILAPKSAEEKKEAVIRRNKRIIAINNFVDDIRYFILIIVDFFMCVYSHVKNKRLRRTWTKAGYRP